MSDDIKARCPCCKRLFRPVTVRDVTCRRAECVKAWRNRVRYSDDKAAERHKIARARYITRNPDKYGTLTIANAYALLKDAGEL
jgi:hypothetical protein